MLAFLTNLSYGEILVAAVVAVLIFGKRLPEVAGRAYLQIRKMRQSLEDLRRETGIDTELRSIERSVRDAAEEASFTVPTEPRAARLPGDTGTEPTAPASEEEGGQASGEADAGPDAADGPPPS